MTPDVGACEDRRSGVAVGFRSGPLWDGFIIDRPNIPSMMDRGLHAYLVKVFAILLKSLHHGSSMGILST